MPPVSAPPPAPPVPSLESLRCFNAAAHSPTFRAAAKAVALTPAALGQRIRQLETQLGMRLFERTTRSVALTAAGLALVPAARTTLEAAASCLAAARGDKAPPAMELTIGTTMELGLSFLVPSHQALTDSCPGLTLHYFFGAGPELLGRVRTREVDGAVTSVRFADPALASIQLHREEFVLVAARDLVRRTPLSRREHSRRHVLLDLDSSLPLLRAWQEAAGGEELRFARVWRIGSAAAIHQLVQQGRGVAVLPLYMVASELTRGPLVRLFPAVKPAVDHIRLIYRRDDSRQSAFEGLAGALLRLPLR